MCLSDFPSWAEHPARAVRSVAHQVDGWMGLTSGVHEDGGMAGGAMVLTTSKATAAAISEAVAPLLSASGVPLATTETLGNARAVDQFVAQGGVIVGTRGLWQGVDVDRRWNRVDLCCGDRRSRDRRSRDRWNRENRPVRVGVARRGFDRHVEVIQTGKRLAEVPVQADLGKRLGTRLGLIEQDRSSGHERL